MQSATSTKGVSCSVAGAGKVTLIGSNCLAYRVGRCVDSEGGRTAQIFSDCAITKYLSRAIARCARVSTAAIIWRPVLTVTLLNDSGLQRNRPPRWSASIQAPAAVTVSIGRMTVLQCCALLPACCCMCVRI